MKKTVVKKALQKSMAVLLSALMVLSAFAVLPADLFEVSAATATESRLELDFNNNWKFNLGNVSKAEEKGFDDSAWEDVELPHDFSISQDFFTGSVEAESGNLPGGTGWYRKTFSVPAAYKNKTIILNFDGAYKDTWVYVNGELVGENHYGYNTFSIDITEYLTCNGKSANFIAVKVTNDLPSSRWYSGSGIYRDVTLTIVDDCHVDLYGTYVTTPNLESTSGADGTVNAEITLTNTEEAKDVTVTAEILDANGNAVGTSASAEVTAAADAETVVTLTPSLDNPNLWYSWDEGTPYLYTLRTTVLEDGEEIDVYDTTFGYRWIEWDVDNGFYLNGEAVKLQGVCMHHDQGALGSAQVYDAIYRQISILKDMGCNTIRTSHATASTVFMQICNELGMMVMDEFFDGWDEAKNSNSNDFSVYFDQTLGSTNLLNAESTQTWYQFVLTQTVLRDRNDPAVVIWDIGNELGEGTSGVSESNFATYAEDMRTMIDELDGTRPVCQGNNQRNISSGWAGAVDQYMNVIGGNYEPSTWESMESEIKSDVDEVTGETGKAFVYTEAASALSSRGHYTNSYSGNTSTASDGFQINAWDTSAVGWGTEAAESWYYTIINDWFSGEYIWTGFDYIGEPTPYNHTTSNYGSGYPNSSFFGVIDTAGYAKDTYYLYRSWWNNTDTTLHLVPGTWNSGEVYVDSSGYVDVAVYSNADKIELYADGSKIAESIATTTVTAAGHSYQTWAETATNSSICNTTEFYTDTGKDLYSQFHVKYSSVSELTVKAYELQNGTYVEITDTVGTNKVSGVTATQVVASTWTPATTTYTADGDSYIYVEYEAQDADGNFANDYNGTLNIEIQGDSAYIVGVDNGKNTDTKRLQQSSALTSATTATVDMFNGRALVILRTNTTVDEVEVVTSATDVSVNGVTVSVVAETGDELTDEFEEVADQSNTSYEPTLTERYEDIVSELNAYDGSYSPDSGEYTYNLYTPNTTATDATVSVVGSTDLNSFSDGWYIIYGCADYMSYSEGAMTHTATSSGFSTDDATYSSSNLPDSTTDAWYFEKQGTLNYYIYYEDSSGTKQYLNISSSGLSVSTTPQELVVTMSNGEVTIGDSSGNYVNYSGGTVNLAGVWTAATSLTLFGVTYSESASPVDNGEYVIYNQSYIMTGSTHSSGGVSRESNSPTNNVITTDCANDYTFTLVEGTTNQYYIQNSEGLYLALGSSNSSLDLTSTETALTVEAVGDGTIVIYSGSQFVDHFSDLSSDSEERFDSWSSSVSGANANEKLYLYSKDSYVGGGSSSGGTTTDELDYTKYTANTTTTPVENGAYVIYNDASLYLSTAHRLMAGTTSSSGGITATMITPVDDVITTSTSNAYTFTQVSGNQYYIQNSEGLYLAFGSANASLTLTSTATEVTVEGTSDGRIVVYSGSQFLDHYRDEGTFNSWSSSVSGAADNNKMELYREPTTGSETVPEEKAELYSALRDGVEYEPGVYTNRSYTDLIEAMEAGLEVLQDSSADETAIASATTAILEAIDALEVYNQTFKATLYKYGYNPTDTDNPYDLGGNAFNEKTYESMEAIISADENLVNQIKAAIGYDDDTIAWGDDTYKETALQEAIEKYAKIYSIAFTGEPVADATNAGNYEYTAWNVWIKDNTQGADDSYDDGASVQGIFSSTLQDGQPTDHSSYASLPYGNVSSARETFNTTDGISFTYTIADGETVEIEYLPALEDISVHINDMFTKENVLVNPDDESEGYAKFYWDLDLPVVTTSNEFGVNTYSYDSASTDYILQFDFDDETQTATGELNYVDTWSVALSGGVDNGVGFFPFNYQKGTTTYSGESAIYHYAINYALDFHIPTSGDYGDGEDITFSFTGDDDVLVYIDGVLVLDNGGLHGARTSSINFTDASVSYQYAMDVTEGVVKDPNGVLSDDDSTNDGELENSVVYTYGAENNGISADNLAALEKLNEVRTDGGYHTFSFYMVERGSTESNFSIELNIQEISDEVQLENQTYVADYGIPTSYSIRSNDYVNTEAEDLEVQYLGITDGNVTAGETFVFSDPEDVTQTFVGTMSELTVNGMKYGDCTINARGAGVYTLNTMNFTGADHFYNVAQISGDPTYNEGVDYYVYERVRFIPATSIYFEDNFVGVTYNDGSTTDGSGNGVWYTLEDGLGSFDDVYQTADIVDSGSVNPFGYDPAYDNCSIYSGYSAKAVKVSAANNPNNGGTSPTVEFEFTGTGVDLISLTDTTSGVFTVEVLDENGNRVGKRKIVDTYYGYGFGRLYADENGEAVLEETDKPMFKTADGHVGTLTTYYTTDDDGNVVVSADVSYLDPLGGYTDTVTYYDADGNLTTEETENIAYAYAYAYGWVTATEDVEGIYQVPVIKINDLDYGKYTVIITPTYTAMFDNTGAGEYTLYVDAIRIYNPAGVDDDAGLEMTTGYKYANEGYPAYLQIKDMLIGADSLAVDTSTQGIIFIDGIAALNNDLATYSVAGPNNELYLASGQAVAFEAWATAIPDSVQIGAKSAQGTATLGVTYGDNTVEKELTSATDMYYAINSLLPVGGKLTWSRTVIDGVTYYKTNTILISNNSTEESIMSISNIKWTFSNVGYTGHAQIGGDVVDEPVEDEPTVMLMASNYTVSSAYAMMTAKAQAEAPEVTPEVTPDATPEVTPDATPDVTPDSSVDSEATENSGTKVDSSTSTNQASGNSSSANVEKDDTLTNVAVVDKPITVKVTTSTGVTELIIRDEAGNVITPEEIDCAVETLNGKEVKVWTITLTESESGTYTYSVVGEFADGTVEQEDDITIEVVTEEELTFLQKIANFFINIAEFFKSLVSKNYNA